MAQRGNSNVASTLPPCTPPNTVQNSRIANAQYTLVGSVYEGKVHVSMILMLGLPTQDADMQYIHPSSSRGLAIIRVYICVYIYICTYKCVRATSNTPTLAGPWSLVMKVPLHDRPVIAVCNLPYFHSSLHL